MVYEIIWTDRATKSYINNINFLEQAWTNKEVVAFIVDVERKLTALSFHPYLGSPRSNSNHTIRRTVVNERIMLIYRVRNRKQQVELLLFWNTHQHPDKQNNIL